MKLTRVVIAGKEHWQVVMDEPEMVTVVKRLIAGTLAPEKEVLANLTLMSLMSPAADLNGFKGRDTVVGQFVLEACALVRSASKDEPMPQIHMIVPKLPKDAPEGVCALLFFAEIGGESLQRAEAERYWAKMDESERSLMLSCYRKATAGGVE